MKNLTNRLKKIEQAMDTQEIMVKALIRYGTHEEMEARQEKISKEIEDNPEKYGRDPLIIFIQDFDEEAVECQIL